MKQWYEELFDNYGNQYDKEIFVQGTLGECDFIEKELNYDRSKKILDIGCGTGHHAIELTKRGYQVTGIDLSEGQLKRAREKAEKEGLSTLQPSTVCFLFFIPSMNFMTGRRMKGPDT